MQEPAQRLILNMNMTTIETQKLPVFSTTTALAEEAHGLIHDACFLIANESTHSAKILLAKADGLLHDLCNHEAYEADAETSKKVKYLSDHGVNEWVEVVLGNGTQPIKECCITAVKFSQGGHVHYDLVYVAGADDDGTKNYQKMYHVPTGLINGLPKSEE